ncbi:hypothetical protein [Chroococcus sp. FPU101]|uniref:hypothetical protein n=1 Tax=Chroococcus sp. FPU101 TaxID=1974212 RepID=UPI001A8CD831|nr:hypothetical protein [Chroococcus sp. FPU101]GFE71859.1 hypothetical protein CFPU101_44690 [Chroococcus sp. FPU101]
MEIKEQLESILEGIPTSTMPSQRIAFYESYEKLYGYSLKWKDQQIVKRTFILEGRPDITGLDDEELDF